MNVVLQLIGIYFIYYVTSQYFSYHKEYNEIVYDNTYVKTIILNLLIIGGIVFIWQKLSPTSKFFGKKITAFYVFLISLFFTANIMFFSTGVFKSSTSNGLPDVASNFNIITAQFNFILKSVYIIFALLLIVSIGYIIGDFIIKKLKLDEEINLAHVIKSIIIGWIVFMQILFFLGIFNLLISYVLWPLCIAIIIIGYKSLFELWDKFFMQKNILSLKWYGIIGLSVLYYFICLNFVEVVRPIPIGWDDMGAYINMPNLISQYGALINGSYINFHLIEALGWIMFKWTTIALFIAYLGGILAIFAFIIILRYVSNIDFAIMLTTLWYSIPGMVFQSSKDMKTDIPTFAFMLVAFYLFLNFIKSQRWQYLFLTGFVLGGAVFVKVTALTLVTALFPLILFVLFRSKGLILGFGMLMIFVSKADLFKFGQTKITPEFLYYFTILSYIFVIIGLLILFIKKENLLKLKVFSSYFIGLLLGCIITISFNFISVVSAKEDFNLQALLNTKATHSYGKNKITQVDFDKLPDDLKVDKEIQKKMRSGGEEELGRYIGFIDICEKSPYSLKCIYERHIKLPWNITMNIYSKGQYLDITPFFYIAGIIMFLYLLYYVYQSKKNIGNDKVINENLILLIKIGLLFMIISVIFLMFFSAAIHWYSIMFYLAILFLSAIGLNLFYQYKYHYIFYAFIVLILILYTTDTLYRLNKGPHPFFLGYYAGAYGADVNSTNKEIFPGDKAINKLLPGYLGAARQVNSVDLFKNTMYRIGTFIMYFIDKNDSKNIIQDSLLDSFAVLAYDDDYLKTLQRLKALNVKIMIVDLFTPTIDRTPDKSLSKKFVKLINPENFCILVMKKHNKTDDEIKTECKKILDKIQYGAYAYAINRQKKGFIDYFYEAGIIKILTFDPGHGLLLFEIQ